MESNFKISGIYDLRTMTFLKSKGITAFSFDFNPRSLNFLQGHLFREIVHEHYSTQDHYTLRFQDTTLANLKNTINDFLIASGQSVGSVSNLRIEIGEEQTDLISDIGLPVNLRVNLNSNLEALATHTNVQGMVIHYADLALDKDHTKALHFLNRLFLMKSRKDNFQVDLTLGLEENISRSIFDFYSFNHIDISINRKLEVCYRNVNLALLEKEISTFEKALT